MQCELKRRVNCFNYGLSVLRQTLSYYRLRHARDSGPKGSLVLAAGFRPVDGLSRNLLLQLLDFFLSESEEALVLLKTYDIYLFMDPNPDGRLLGNSLRGAAGNDLSSLMSYSKLLHPELYCFYRTLREIDSRAKVAMFIQFDDDWQRSANQRSALHHLRRGGGQAAVPARVSDNLHRVLHQLRLR